MAILDPRSLLTWMIVALFAVVLLLAFRVTIRWYRVQKKRERGWRPVVKTPRPRFRLEKGGSYLLPEPNPQIGMEVFKSELARGITGLCVTRTFPQRIRNRFSLEHVPMIWLTRSNRRAAAGKKVTHIPPTKLGLLIEELTDFIEQRPETVLLFDGLEYLIVHNQFERVVRFIHELADEIALHRSRLIISYNPKALDDEQRAMIEREAKLLSI